MFKHAPIYLTFVLASLFTLNKQVYLPNYFLNLAFKISHTLTSFHNKMLIVIIRLTDELLFLTSNLAIYTTLFKH